MIFLFVYIILVIVCIILTMYFLKGSRDDYKFYDTSVEDYNIKVTQKYNSLRDKKFAQWRSGSKIDDDAEWTSRGK